MVKKMKTVVPVKVVKKPKLSSKSKSAASASKPKVAKAIVKKLQFKGKENIKVKKIVKKVQAASQVASKSKPTKKKVIAASVSSSTVAAPVPIAVNGIDVDTKTQPRSVDEDGLLNRLNDRLCETEKKLAIILSYIRNQYGEGHSIIQLVKASIGQPLDEELVCNVGRVSGPQSRPIFCPPTENIEYPRHVWVPRDSIPSSEYEHAYAPIPKTVKSKKTASTKCKVVSTMTGLDPIPPPPVEVEAAPPSLRPLELLEAELDNVTRREGPADGGVPASELIYSDSEDEEALLHEQPLFETIRSIVAAADGDDSFYQEEDEGPSFQILSTTSLAPDPTAAGGGEYYTCIECNRRFISVRQLASHSLVHSKNESGSTVKNGPTIPAKTKAAVKSKKEKRVKKTKDQPQPKKQNRPMPGSLSGRAPSTLKPKPGTSKTKSAIVSKVSMIAKKRTAAAPSAPVVCELCDKLCSNRNSYNYHKIIQHNAKKTIFICSVCQKCCPSAAALSEHQSIVHGTEAQGKPNGSGGGGGRSKNSKFTCKHCSKVFTSVARLGLHMKTHWTDKQKQHKCGDCGHTFKNGDALASHAKIVHGKVMALAAAKGASVEGAAAADE